MLKVGKTGVAIVMGLVLSLTLLASGAFAQDITTAQSSASAGSRSVALAGTIQQGAQQLLPTSNAQQLKAGLTTTWCGRYFCGSRYYGRYNRYGRYGRYGRYRRYGRYNRFGRFGGISCRWVRQGWGRWGRTVRVCRRW